MIVMVSDVNENQTLQILSHLHLYIPEPMLNTIVNCDIAGKSEWCTIQLASFLYDFKYSNAREALFLTRL